MGTPRRLGVATLGKALIVSDFRRILWVNATEEQRGREIALLLCGLGMVSTFGSFF